MLCNQTPCRVPCRRGRLKGQTFFSDHTTYSKPRANARKFLTTSFPFNVVCGFRKFKMFLILSTTGNLTTV